ncbi:hypothetical protein TUM4438_43150 [Shewanella sairae]|uniref:Uncharacterized protein n=1 Tax=Shewanella sairae TaxID=190310 RepID=A0ABQ4PR48_9GAMM|nr:hypothetical protein [Shewanella sairae]MCL1132453.1 hypothetical protein [Shewanella sairae]GIU51920.1 hypothetical protein TUM4438_43150 [Shewanella sairae]
MSKAPGWMNSAQNNKTGNTVGTVAEVTQKRKKPGPKKSVVLRKNRIIKISDNRSNDIDTLEAKLKNLGIPLTRGRSETIELALSVLNSMIENPDKSLNGEQWINYVKEITGQEDKDSSDM